MNLILTSDGLTHEKIKQCFLTEVRDLARPRIAVLYTVKNPGDEDWLIYRQEELDSLGQDYDLINISKNIDLSTNLLKYGIIYICGGNTYYILDRLRKTGVDKAIKKLESENALYIGLSAGSIIAGPDIEIAGLGSDGDENDINLNDLTGFSLVPFSIYPHYHESEKSLIEDYLAKNKKPLITLTDNQAILIKRDEYIRLGEDDGTGLGSELNKII